MLPAALIAALLSGCGSETAPDPKPTVAHSTTTQPRATTTPSTTLSAIAPPPPIATTTAAPTSTTTLAPPPPAPAPDIPTVRAPAVPTPEAPSAYYRSCAAARAAGAAPLHRGDPGYRSGLDRDGDGVACEN